MVLNNLEFYKDIVQNIPEGIVICDTAFTIVDVNAVIENLTGFKKQELIGKSFNEMVVSSKDSCPICLSKKDSAFIPEQFAHLADIFDKNGNKIPIRVNHKSSNGYYISVISALSDIAFLNQAHIDFVSTVSHELRTPLTSIKGFADTILTSGDKLPQEQQKRFIIIIKSQIDRLTRLVENLLTVSRLESKKDKSIFKAVNFEKFIEGILHGIQLKAQNHTIKLNILPNLPQIWADTDKFEQIMTNLIDNAIKYSNPDTVVTIEAGFSANNSDFVEIKVKDEGVGIPKEFLPKIFTKFSRIDNPLTRQVQGTGLGLYITKSLVENMGGKITADSDGKGSTFTVKLPVATPERHAAQKFLEERA